MTDFLTLLAMLDEPQPWEYRVWCYFNEQLERLNNE